MELVAPVVMAAMVMVGKAGLAWSVGVDLVVMVSWMVDLLVTAPEGKRVVLMTVQKVT